MTSNQEYPNQNYPQLGIVENSCLANTINNRPTSQFSNSYTLDNMPDMGFRKSEFFKFTSKYEQELYLLSPHAPPCRVAGHLYLFTCPKSSQTLILSLLIFLSLLRCIL
jgi:hypothetical protein